MGFLDGVLPNCLDLSTQETSPPFFCKFGFTKVGLILPFVPNTPYTCYARFPSDTERQVCVAVYQEKEMTRQRATEDILWAIFNTPEFIIKD